MSNSPPESSMPPTSPLVKEKMGGTHLKRIFQTQLQGQMLIAVEEYSSELGLSLPDFVVYCIEKELVREKRLPDWWSVRSSRIK